MLEQIVLQIVVPSDGRARWAGYYWHTPDYASEVSDLTVKTAELR